jgi:hypothetical protein
VNRRTLLAATLALALTSHVDTLAKKKKKKKKFKDRNCDDFSSQEKAQKFFEKNQPRKDPHGLDADHDGIACEDSF